MSVLSTLFFFFQIFFRLSCFPNGKNRGRPKSTKPSQQQQAESVRSKQSAKAARRTTQKVFTAGKQRNKKHWRQFLKRTNAEMPVGIPGLKTQRAVRKRATGAIHEGREANQHRWGGTRVKDVNVGER